MTDSTAEADEDLCTCEMCSASVPWEEVTSCDGGGWHCRKCQVEWEAVFAACDHRWEPTQLEDGEPGVLCRRCMGGVAVETWPRLFPGKPLPVEAHA